MKNIGIFTHRGCDLDALCSTNIIATYLKEKYDNISVFPITEPSWLEDKVSANVKRYKKEELKDKKLDYAIICDVNEKDLVYGLELLEQIAKNNRYQIDHHSKNRVELEVDEDKKIIVPSASATCQIIFELLKELKYPLTNEIATNIFLGIASDTSGLKTGLTKSCEEVIKSLPLTKQEKEELLQKIKTLVPKQKELLNCIEEEYNTLPNIKFFKLLVPSEEGDITPMLNHEAFNDLTSPTNDYPVTCFIIGCGNNFCIKLKKINECNIDILSIAINNNGGGHSNRCVGRIYNSTYQEVLKKIVNDYQSLLKEQPKVKKLK